ncbi:protein of unknown function DUF86 [Methanosarcina barkeri str. Wiesmoor]|uniref:DUF86 domain-containing protein n=2 Tax=Methanosarcina barkeri TaxID=2208 RepID=A0A0E3QNT5_METBA|nr:DUF86 domain-containing protein [Methanosarcina barkeri]AKB51523.1 protein of unknown function DUF86 [Methanosarcina barkeri str. Wiesmoor]
MQAEEEDTEDFLIDILDSIEKIESFIEGFGFEDFSTDNKTIYAVILALEIIGEATKSLPDSLKMEHPEIPWREMSGLRDKMVHGDFGLDLEAIWDIAVEDISTLKPLIIKILS